MNPEDLIRLEKAAKWLLASDKAKLHNVCKPYSCAVLAAAGEDSSYCVYADLQEILTQ